MYRLETNASFDSAHFLKGYQGKCSNIHGHRWKVEVAVAGGNEVVVLGAFGCGAFENNPEVVARASKEVVAKYAGCFEVIEFAIYCSPRDEENYKIFKRVLGV